MIDRNNHLYILVSQKHYSFECPKPMWQGDGRCDDINNIEICKFDGGDCCGSNVDKSFCIQCECKEDIAMLDGQVINGLCNVALFTDGECNPENNNAECGFDGGDCVFVQSNFWSLFPTFSYINFFPLKLIVSTLKNIRTTYVMMQTMRRNVDLMERIVV